MTRPLKPLSAYPAQFTRLATAAIQSPQLFPISIPYPEAKNAMDFRVQFYQYRRALRAHLERTALPSADMLLQAQGAELIQSPRISPMPDAPDDQYNCVFRLSSELPAQKTGLSALDALLGEAPSPKVRETPVLSIAHQEPHHIFAHKGQTYFIPVADLPEELRDLPLAQIQMMFKTNLLELPNPIYHYVKKG